MEILKKALLIGMIGALATGLTFAASAHAHALPAQRASSVTMSHTHLHPVINRLAGPKGTDYDAAAGDPCQGRGNGALTDSASNHALHGKLENALADVQAGLKSNTGAVVQGDAGKKAATADP